MKIKITYLPVSETERTAAHLVSADCKKILTAMGIAFRVRESDTRPPFRHVYISARSPGEDDR